MHKIPDYNAGHRKICQTTDQMDPNRQAYGKNNGGFQIIQPLNVLINMEQVKCAGQLPKPKHDEHGIRPRLSGRKKCK